MARELDDLAAAEEQHREGHGEKDGHDHPPLHIAGLRYFFSLPWCQDISNLNAQVALMGVPHDYGSIIPSLRTGSARGPSPVSLGWFDIEDETEYLKGVTMADVGNVSIIPGEIGGNLDRSTEVVQRVAKRDALVTTVGGDHSISFPVGRGMERYESVNVVHFDAHPDYSDTVWGSKYSHGSQLRQPPELAFIANITMIGIRRSTKQAWQDDRNDGISIVTSGQLIREGAADSIDRIVIPSRFLYVSLDTDVLDQA